MPIDFGKRQTIEEITGGRIKKKMQEEREVRSTKKVSVPPQSTAKRGSASR